MINAYDELIRQAVALHLQDYDWRLYKAQLHAESALNPDAVSPVGAKGIAQFMPKTWMQVKKQLSFSRHASSKDPYYAVYAGAYYMSRLIGKWTSPRPDADRYCLALASYNAGAGNLFKAQKAAGNVNDYSSIIGALPQITGKNSHETTTYVKRILASYVKLIVG